MHIVSAILTFLALPLLGFVRSQDPPVPVGPSIPPPAGRALLSRSAHLEPWDYPPSTRATFDTRLHIHPHYPILGPPNFWTQPSLQSHYLSTLHLRYHPRLYPTPPPFEVWLKEQKLIRAINIQHHMIEIELTRPQEEINPKALLHFELQLGDLTILLRQLQIATALEYAKLAPEWRRYEESMYRHWSSFLAISQEGLEEEKEAEEYWRSHLGYVKRLAREKAEEEERERVQREEEARAEKGSGKKRFGNGNEGEEGWREIQVERGDLESSTPKRWQNTPTNVVLSSPDDAEMGLKRRLESSTPKRWLDTPNVGANAGEDATKALIEAFGKRVNF